MNADERSSRGCERQRVEKRHLPRLPPDNYRGYAFIHWIMTLEDRATGWLAREFHSIWSLILLHASARYNLVCPTYVLMPDHVHVLWLGHCQHDSDQRVAIEFLQSKLRTHIAPADWQRQPYDHVLCESERAHDAFLTTACYILENPVRAKLVSDWREYPYSGCCMPGYPEFDPLASDYWERFWRCYNYLIEKSSD
jgi:REP element-mobilizing transposase RayT